MRVFLATASCHPDYGGPAFLVARLAQTLSLRGVELSVWAADGSATTTPLLPVTCPIERLSGSITEAIEEARQQGVQTVVGVANANSTPGFLRRLSFELVGPLPRELAAWIDMCAHQDEFGRHNGSGPRGQR